jgi:hypothetical protein
MSNADFYNQESRGFNRPLTPDPNRQYAVILDYDEETGYHAWVAVDLADLDPRDPLAWMPQLTGNGSCGTSGSFQQPLQDPAIEVNGLRARSGTVVELRRDRPNLSDGGYYQQINQEIPHRPWFFSLNVVIRAFTPTRNYVAAEVTANLGSSAAEYAALQYPFLLARPVDLMTSGYQTSTLLDGLKIAPVNPQDHEPPTDYEAKIYFEGPADWWRGGILRCHDGYDSLASLIWAKWDRWAISGNDPPPLDPDSNKTPAGVVIGAGYIIYQWIYLTSNADTECFATLEYDAAPGQWTGAGIRWLEGVKIVHANIMIGVRNYNPSFWYAKFDRLPCSYDAAQDEWRALRDPPPIWARIQYTDDPTGTPGQAYSWIEEILVGSGLMVADLAATARSGALNAWEAGNNSGWVLNNELVLMHYAAGNQPSLKFQFHYDPSYCAATIGYEIAASPCPPVKPASGSAKIYRWSHAASTWDAPLNITIYNSVNVALTAPNNPTNIGVWYGNGVWWGYPLPAPPTAICTNTIGILTANTPIPATFTVNDVPLGFSVNDVPLTFGSASIPVNWTLSFGENQGYTYSAVVGSQTYGTMPAITAPSAVVGSIDITRVQLCGPYSPIQIGLALRGTDLTLLTSPTVDPVTGVVTAAGTYAQSVVTASNLLYYDGSTVWQIPFVLGPYPQTLETLIPVFGPTNANTLVGAPSGSTSIWDLLASLAPSGMTSALGQPFYITQCTDAPCVLFGPAGNNSSGFTDTNVITGGTSAVMIFGAAGYTAYGPGEGTELLTQLSSYTAYGAGSDVTVDLTSAGTQPVHNSVATSQEVLTGVSLNQSVLTGIATTATALTSVQLALAGVATDPITVVVPCPALPPGWKEKNAND